MENPKVSLVTTIYNEADSIKDFIASIENQSTSPNEVIFVDAGSRDDTVKIIKHFFTTKIISPKKYRLFIKKNCNRSEGRNQAISQARYPLIAVTDAGCHLDKDWLKFILKPFNQKGTNAVAGFYRPIINSPLEDAVSLFVCTQPNKVVDGFLPSSRSIAFKKSVWLKVNGYPDGLNYCEDLVFDQKVVQAGYRFVLAPNALVYWPQRNKLSSIYRQFYNYAYGDGQVFFSRYQTHSFRILLLYLRYLLLLILGLVLALEPRLIYVLFAVYVAYLLQPAFIYWPYVKYPSTILYLPIVKLLADIAVISGSFTGIVFGKRYE